MTFNSSDFGEVRTVVIDGEPWFVGRDVTEILGYGDGNKKSRALTNAINTHVDEEDRRWLPYSEFKVSKNGDSENINHNGAIVVNESGVYALIFGSKLKSAKKFKHWVTSEILPSVRKNGGYIAKQETLSPEQIVANALVVANNIIEQKNKQIAEMKPKSDYFDELVDSKLLTNFRDTAKELGYSQNEFTAWLAAKGYIYRDSKGIIKPKEPYCKQGLFQMKDFQNPYSSYKGVQTYVTVKGKNTFRLLMQLRDETVVE
jgi:prophage antirepressor-like protein